jgi:hypothetical protein
VKPGVESGDGQSDVNQELKPAVPVTGLIQKWRGRDGNDASVDIAKDDDQRF